MTRPAQPIFIVVVAALVAGACATNPATGKREFSLMSEEQEIAAGQQNDVEVRREMGVYDDRGRQLIDACANGRAQGAVLLQVEGQDDAIDCLPVDEQVFQDCRVAALCVFGFSLHVGVEGTRAGCRRRVSASDQRDSGYDAGGQRPAFSRSAAGSRDAADDSDPRMGLGS